MCDTDLDFVSFFFSSRRRHTRFDCDWSSDVCSSDLFKDNGYQMGNEKDAPIYQNPSYWPVSFRITPHWHRESVDHADITNPLPTGATTEGRLTTHGFDVRSEEHTSELQSQSNLVCRL